MAGDAAAGNHSLQGFRQLAERPQFEGHLFKVDTVTFADPDGHQFERDVVRHPGAVLIIPVHPDGTVTLVRQVRVAVGVADLEAPAGTRDVHGEDPEATGRRELEEEAGLIAGRFDRLGAFYNSPGYTDQQTIVYLATDLSAGATHRSGPEEKRMSTERVALGDVEKLVADGTLHDATTIAGLLLARHAFESGRRGTSGL